MIPLTATARPAPTLAPAPDAVLRTFATYQPKTAAMVAEEFDVDEGTAREILRRLVRRGDLTNARAGTGTPVWIRTHPGPAPTD